MLDDRRARQALQSIDLADERPGFRRIRFGLTLRVLLLIIGFVVVAEAAIFIPSIASFRDGWLQERLSSAYTAALVFEAAPPDMVPPDLAKNILTSVGARTIVLKMKDSRHLLAVSDMPEKVDESYDLRSPNALESMMAALRALAAPAGRTLMVRGAAPMGAQFIEITMDEAPLSAAMAHYALDILLISLAICFVVAALAVVGLNFLVLRPVRRLTSSLMDFGADPEDASRIIKPSGRRDEIGLAEDALAVMQGALVRELNQKKHLAALGLAVAKINHDLRNMLASAQLLSDRLASVADPLAARLAPKLVSTLDRAIAFCQSTLTYGRAAEQPPKFMSVELRQVVDEASEIVAPAGIRAVEIANEVPRNLCVHVDQEQMLRVIMNLCRNAVEALESAGPTPGQSPRVTVSARRDGERVFIEVADTGPGVPDRARMHLFEAFQGSTRPGGSGLGLAIAADLVRAHGGNISLLPSSDCGATFRISLPMRD